MHSSLPAHLELADIIRLATEDSVSEVSESDDRVQTIARFLEDASIEELTTIHGVGPTIAKAICAGIKVGKLSSLQKPMPTKILNPEDAYQAAKEALLRIGRTHQECFLVLMLTVKNSLIDVHLATMGTLTSAPVNPREVFRPCIRRSCSNVIFAHNHPSGDPTPSDQDRGITDRLISAGDLIGIEVLDHIILGDDTFVSLKEDRLFRQ